MPTETPISRPPRPPRERMVRSAAELIRRHGVTGTGLREIVREADAPRGSLQHYFPGGKDELVSAALQWIGGVAARRVRRSAERLEDRRPSALLAAVVEDWRHDLVVADYGAGCPLVGAAVDVSATNDQLRETIRQAFAEWQEPLRAALVDLGVPDDRAGRLAVLVMSALEGAIILCRVQGDMTAFDALVDELGPALDAAVVAR